VARWRERGAAAVGRRPAVFLFEAR
jgi:hypothetical protein